MGSVLSDVTGARRGTVLALLPPAGADRRHTVQALVPLASLIGYAGALRSQTGGEASLSLELSHYAPLDEHAHAELLMQQRGYM